MSRAHKIHEVPDQAPDSGFVFSNYDDAVQPVTITVRLFSIDSINISSRCFRV